MKKDVSPSGYQDDKIVDQTAINTEREQILIENQRQKALLDAIFEADPGGLAVVTGSALRFRYVNPVYRFIVPDPEKDPLGRTYASVWADAEDRFYLREIRSTLRAGKPLLINGITHLFTNGSTRVLTLQARRIDWIGQPAALLILWDTTDLNRAIELATRKQQEAEAHAVELEALFSQMTDAVMVYSLDAVVRKTNPIAVSSLGFDPVGMPADEAARRIQALDLEGRLVDFAEVLAQQALNGKTIRNQRLHLMRVGGKSSMVTAHANPLHTSRREMNGALVSWHDMTEQEQIEQSLRLSEARYRRLIETAMEGIWTVDAGGKTEFINPHGAAILGYTVEEMLGRPIQDFIFLEDAPEVAQRLARRRRGIADTSLEVRLRHKDGHEVWVASATNPILDEHGEYQGVLSMFADRSERRKAELAIQQSEGKYRAFFNNLRETVSVFEAIRDEQGEVVDWIYLDINQIGLQLLGRDRAQVVGRPVSQVLGKAALEANQSEYWHVLETGEPAQHERAYQNQHFLVTVFRMDENRVASLGLDITGRKQAEDELRQSAVALRANSEALEQSQQRLADILASLHDGFFELDRDWRFTYVNERAAQNSGYTSEELVGENIWEKLPFIVGTEYEEIYRRVMITRQPENHELQSLVREMWFGLSVSPSAEGITVYWQDITERKQAHQALLESEAKYRTLFEAMGEGFVLFQLIWDKQGQPVELIILDTNPAFERQAGLRREQVLHRQVGEVLPIIEPMWYERFGEVVRSGQAIRFEGYNASLDRWFEVYAYSLYHDDQFCITFHNITDRKQAEEVLHANAAQREIHRRLIEQREQERTQIARDLHDGPIQELGGAIMTLQGILDRCPDPETVEQVAALRRHLQAQISELRAYAQELRPPALAKFGLEKAIQSHLEGFQEQHPEIQFAFEPHMEHEQLPEQVRVAYYRIYQEALNNIAKHAQATQVTIRLRKEHQQVILEIEDNGIGFVLPQDWLELAQNGHLGLVGMRERAEAIGAKFDIASHQGKGTILTVTIAML